MLIFKLFTNEKYYKPIYKIQGTYEDGPDYFVDHNVDDLFFGLRETAEKFIDNEVSLFPQFKYTVYEACFCELYRKRFFSKSFIYKISAIIRYIQHKYVDFLLLIS